MKVALKQIQDGTFKKQFADENATDGANLKEMRAAEGRKEIEDSINLTKYLDISNISFE